MNEILNIRNDSNFPIDGRELHEKLGIETPYTKWFDRMCEYGFSKETDYTVADKNVHNSNGGRQTISNHSLTLSMAKEFCAIRQLPFRASEISG